ncbi:hypothetical protein EI94DRAFT_1696146 [Lactarius quietus]|nr:hypothetical protein EI94DRAFT_1696146 [Lactarius quietus]
MNKRWYILTFINLSQQWYTHHSQLVPVPSDLGLGYWDITDPPHPLYQAPTTGTFSARPTPINVDSSDSSGSSTVSAQSTASSQIFLPAIDHSNAPPTEAFANTVTLQGTLPLDPPAAPMSVNTTTTNPPSNGGLKGTAPTIFTGDRSRSDTFWNEFRQYRLLNRNNEMISNPFY